VVTLQNQVIINQVEKRKLIMPNVNGKKYAYTPAGIAKAKKAAAKTGVKMKSKPKAKPKARK
jgi:hypothetical protein